MFNKLIIFTIFTALLAITRAQTEDVSGPLVPPRPMSTKNSTICFVCESPGNCLAPRSEICNQTSANRTRATLAEYFSDVHTLSNATSQQFECFRLRYTSKKRVQIAVSGCINSGLNPCGLHPKDAALATANKSCNKCSKILCNPAGTFSSSLALIMSSAVFGWLLLKH